MTTIPIRSTCFLKEIRIQWLRGDLPFLALLLLSFLLTTAAVCAEGQPGLLDLKQRDQDAEIIQKPQGSTTPPPAPEKRELAPPGPRRPSQPSGTVQREKAALQRAWQLYKRGDDAGALPLFHRVSGSSQRSMALEAKLGLAYVTLRQGEQQRARGLLEELVKQTYRVKEVLPNLLSLLLLDGDDEGAKPYLALLPDDERTTWTDKFREAVIRKEWQQVMTSENPQTLDQFTKNHHGELEGCLANDLFLQVAERLLAAERRKEAASIYHTLLTCVADNWEIRLGIVRALSAALSEKEIQTLISEEKKRGGSSGYLRGLFSIEIANLKKMLGSLEPNSPEVETVARQILSLEPEDLSARRALAWTSYNRGDYGEAYALFSALQKQHPGEKDIALGLVYSGLQRGKTKEVLAFIEKVDFPDAEWQKARVQVYLKGAGESYASKEYGESERFLTKVLTLEAENADAKSLLGWVYYAEDRDEKALSVFLDQYRTTPSLDPAQGVLSVYDRQGERRNAFRFAESMKTSNLSPLKREAADFFYRHDAPIRAAQTCGDPDTCYHNADKTSVEALVWYRSKSGDDGFSRLEEWSFPMTLSTPVGFGKRWTFSLIPTYLSSGSTGPSLYAGNYYRHLNGVPQKQPWETSLWGWRPEAGVEVEGAVKYGFLLGTSLLNSPVSPVPTFNAGASGENWRVNVHQLQVDESVLSYAGERDPYTKREWGRVMKTGAEGEVTFDPAPSYWLSLKGGYDYLWGKNVWSNQSIQGTVAFGKTIPLGMGELSPGIFATLKHFERNTDFFTFGHGGYFSPDIFFMAGPTLRYRTTQCGSFAFDGEVSAGYQHYTTEDSPHYPLLEGSLSSLNGAARRDALGTYRGETESKVGFSGKTRVLKLLGNHWIISGFVGTSNSSGFREWQAGMGLQYFLKSIFNVGEFKHFLRGTPPR